VASDLWFFPGGNNLDLVCGKAKELQAVGGQRSDVSAVLSDAAGEDEQVDSTEKGCIRTDYFAHRSGKDVQRKSCARIVGAHPLFQRLHMLSPEERAKRPL